MSDNTKGALVAVACVAAFLAILIGVIVAVDLSERPNKRPFHHEGDIVVSRLTGQRGQIISRHWRPRHGKWKYGVRFAGTETTTDTHLLAADGPVKQKGFQIVAMWAYEIEKAGQQE